MTPYFLEISTGQKNEASPRFYDMGPNPKARGQGFLVDAHGDHVGMGAFKMEEEEFAVVTVSLTVRVTKVNRKRGIEYVVDPLPTGTKFIKFTVKFFFVCLVLYFCAGGRAKRT